MTIVVQPDRRVLTENTLAELVERLGDIPLERIRAKPSPGTATEEDVLAAAAAPLKRLCELVDGVLVEKPKGFRESVVASKIARRLGTWVEQNNLGIVSGADGTLRLWPGRVRVPDVAFIAWERLPGGKITSQPIPELFPNLIVEVLSESNTPREMALKREDCFRVGCQLIWEVDPATRCVHVYSDAGTSTRLAESDTLDGGAVVPGLRLPVGDLFAELAREPGSP